MPTIFKQRLIHIIDWILIGNSEIQIVIIRNIKSTGQSYRVKYTPFNYSADRRNKMANEKFAKNVPSGMRKNIGKTIKNIASTIDSITITINQQIGRAH